MIDTTGMAAAAAVHRPGADQIISRELEMSGCRSVQLIQPIGGRRGRLGQAHILWNSCCYT